MENCEAVNVVLATCTVTKYATLHGKWPFMVGGYGLTLISLCSVMLKLCKDTSYILPMQRIV